jgi:hypothetical protein
MQECAEAARSVASAGTDADRGQLWSVFDRLPAESQLLDDLLNALLDWHVAAVLATVEEGPLSRSESASPVDTQVPPFLGDAPEDLRQAWRLYQSIADGDDKERESRASDEQIDYQSHRAEFHKAVADLLRDRLSPSMAIEELSQYEWGGWCGTGSNLLYDPRAKALLIASLRLGRADLAVGASAGLNGGFLVDDSAVSKWDRRLLAAAGLDWEQFYIGGVLSGDLSLAAVVARHGSERAARHLLATVPFVEAAQEGPYAPFETMAWPLAALVEAGDACAKRASFNSQEVERDPEADTISADLQAAVLGLLEGRIGPEAGLREADTASLLLAQLCRPESRAAFRTMVGSRYDEVRQRGASGLRALGERVADPRRSRPVAFRIVVDGRPFGRHDVQSTLQLTAGEQFSSAVSDDRGVVELARDPFLDPRDRVTAVRLETPQIESPGDLWFGATVSPPSNLDSVKTVSIRTGALTVEVPDALLGDAGDTPPTLELQALVDRLGVHEMPTEVGSVPMRAGRVTFRRLQHGRYQVSGLRGDRVFESDIVELGARPATLTVRERSFAQMMQEALRPEH